MALPDDSRLPFSLLQYYATSPYTCSYLPDRQARSQVATPTHLINTEIYSTLVRCGFRRSGMFAYQPHCDDCQECVPVRLPAKDFSPDRSQRRNWKKWAGQLNAQELPLEFNPEHFALYQRYQSTRHAGGGMDQDDHEQYEHFLLQSRVDTRLIEFRHHGQLVMVSLIDVLADGLSSVYTFFDPDQKQAGFGTYNILWQIIQTRALDLPYLYLGYWIAQSQKMAYKARFRPLEGFQGGQWQPLP